MGNEPGESVVGNASGIVGCFLVGNVTCVLNTSMFDKFLRSAK